MFAALRRADRAEQAAAHADFRKGAKRGIPSGIHFADFLTSHGYIVCGNDHLGHGNSVRSNDDLGFFAGAKSIDTAISDEA